MYSVGGELGCQNCCPVHLLRHSRTDVLRVKPSNVYVSTVPKCLLYQRCKIRSSRWPGSHAPGSAQRRKTVTRVVPVRPIKGDEIDKHEDVKLLDADGPGDEGDSSDGGGPRTMDIAAELRERKLQQEAERRDSRLASDIRVNSRDAQRSTRLQWRPKSWWADFEEFKGKLAYNYFNWRQDTWSDLLLFTALNVMLLVGLGAVKGALDANSSTQVPAGIPGIWLNIYQILVIIFGQELPDAAADVMVQVFSVLVATTGLAIFALVLALVEQVVLEVLDRNVRKGSFVYENGHLLVLAWAENRRDEETVWKILTQACLAYRNDGGITVVVLCQREKLEMEAACRRIIPPQHRYGSRFVFRQGSPLVPNDLRGVAAAQAGATIVVSDSNRPSDEADAEAIRAGVLLDELDFPGFGVEDPRKGAIIVELHESTSVELLHYCCSSRVMPVPTCHFNALRIARMVKNPVLGILGQQMWNFDSPAQVYIRSFPRLVGLSFGELFKYFPDGTVLGLYDFEREKCQINPPPHTLVTETSEIVLLHPTSFPGSEYRPTLYPKEVEIGDWDPNSYVRKTHMESINSSLLKSVSVDGSRDDVLADAPFVIYPADAVTGANVAQGCKYLYILPAEYISSSDEAINLLITGWGERTFMSDLLQSLDYDLPPNSQVTLFNERQGIMARVHKLSLKNISVLHVRGNPLRRLELAAKIDIRKYKAAIILVDQSWVDPDMDATNGLQLKNQSDMLRLDSLSMAVQLNIRKLLQDAKMADINIISEKSAYEGLTRFEDRERLPLGTNFNMTAYGASLLLQSAVSPKVLKAFHGFGRTRSEVVVQDSSCFAEKDEELSYWELQARAGAVNQIVIGFFEIPVTIDCPLDMVFNPQGDDMRSQQRVWNRGNNRVKLMTLIRKSKEEHVSHTPNNNGNGKGTAKSLPVSSLDKTELPTKPQYLESVADAPYPGGPKGPVGAVTVECVSADQN
eukprot:jgi/Botrbrau1/5060/Bobra.37_1s0025.1